MRLQQVVPRMLESELHYEPQRPVSALHRAPVRLALAIVAVLVAVGAGSRVQAVVGGDSTLGRTLGVVLSVGAAAVTYKLFVRYVEQRPVTELGLAGMGRELVFGFGIGAFLLGTTLVVLRLLDMVAFDVSAGTWAGLYDGLLLAIVAAFVEELVVRGVVFRILEETLGSWIALGSSAVVFGALHLTNDNATIWSSAAIGLEAGILLGAAFMLTRRLWLAIAVHFVWNFLQGGVFGLPVSGEVNGGRILGTLSGNEWVSGGAFGLEASVIVVGLCLAVAVLFLRAVQQRGGIVSPFWIRDRSLNHSGHRSG